MIRNPLKLKTKIAVLFIVLLAAWTFLIIISADYFLSKNARHLIRERGKSLVQTISHECEPLVHYEDYYLLSLFLERQMKAVPEIRYVYVLESDGTLIWSTPTSGMPKKLLLVPHERLVAEDISVQLIRSNGELIYDYEYERSGVVVRLGLSLVSAQKMLRQTILYIIGIGLVGLVAILAIAMYISRPLESLSLAVERALRLDRDLEGERMFHGTFETATIAMKFNELMDRLEERTREVDLSRKLASLGQISASMAHEINNPLGIIAINADFLSKKIEGGGFDEKTAKEVGRLNTAARRACFVVNKLLQFTRYSTQGSRTPFHPVNMETLVRECIDLLEDRAQISQSSFRLEIPDELPMIACDGQGIQQVIFNLLTNALEAQHNGGEITIWAFADEERLTLKVQDNGEGMNEEILKQVMVPFFTTRKDGTGLGLAISRSIVEAHDGELFLESSPGAGTVATVCLPRTSKSEVLP